MARTSSRSDPRAVIHRVLTRESGHMSLDEAVAGFPARYFNTRPARVPYTFWHLLEHVRIAQWDLLEYARNPEHVSPRWPEGFWPARDARTDAAGWKRTIAAIRADARRMGRLLADPRVDPFAPIPFADNRTLVRCAFLVLDHTAYHLGEFAILRQVMNLWPRGRRP